MRTSNYNQPEMKVTFFYFLITMGNSSCMESYKLTKYRSSLPEVFCKRRCSTKFRKIKRKTPVPVSFLIKLQSFFYRTPSVAPSINIKILPLTSKLTRVHGSFFMAGGGGGRGGGGGGG